MQKSDKLIRLSDAPDAEIRAFAAHLPESIRETYTLTRHEYAKLLYDFQHEAATLKRSIPLKCRGEHCPLIGGTKKDRGNVDQCFFLKNKLFVPGGDCMVETHAINQLAEEYADALEINLENRVEKEQLRAMVECDIMEMRASGEISKNYIFDYQPVGVTDDGKPILRKEPAVAINIKETFRKRKDNILKQFIATREQKAKLGKEMGDDTSSRQAELRKIGEAMKKAKLIKPTDTTFTETTIIDNTKKSGE